MNRSLETLAPERGSSPVRKSVFRLLFLCLVVGLSLSACNCASECPPGGKEECPCPGDTFGQKTCKPNGQWSACNCAGQSQEAFREKTNQDGGSLETDPNERKPNDQGKPEEKCSSPGEEEECSCPDASLGQRTCQPQKTWSSCRCNGASTESNKEFTEPKDESKTSDGGSPKEGENGESSNTEAPNAESTPERGREGGASDGVTPEARQDSPPETKSCSKNEDCPVTERCEKQSNRCVACDAGTSRQGKETCNNKDDDCNGLVDDGITRACYTGPTGTKGVGRCKEGKAVCVNGAWSKACTGELVPAKAETCGNKVDDNCNGTVDEACTPAYRNKGTGDKGKTQTSSNDIVVDAAGNAYIAGYFYKGNIAFGPHKLILKGNSNGYIAKMNSSGKWEWAVQIHSSIGSTPKALALGPKGNLYVVGSFNDFVTIGKLTVKTSKGQGYVGVLNPSTSQAIKLFPFNLSSRTMGEAIAVETNGNIVVGGIFLGKATVGTTSIASNGTFWDAFVAKYSPSGKPLWAAAVHNVGGNTTGSRFSVAVNAKGNVWFAGNLRPGGTAQGFKTINFNGKFKTKNSSAYAIFISRLDVNGKFLWGNVVCPNAACGGPASDDVILDSNDNAFIAGSVGGTRSVAFGSITLPTGSAFGYFSYVAKVDAKGNFVWVKNVGTNDARVRGLALVNKELRFGGSFCRSTKVGTIALKPTQLCDLYLGEITTSGTINWARTIGDSYNKTSLATLNLTSLALGPNTQNYITGTLKGKVTLDGATMQSVGKPDPYAAKIGHLCKTGAPKPGGEVCKNKMDDDCDGKVDEGCP